MGLLLTLARRWALPFGAWTLTLGLNATLMALMCGRWLTPGPLPLIGAALVAGLSADVIRRRSAWRSVAFTTPALFQTLYFASLALWGGGVSWSVHLWTGAIVLAGLAGLLLSYAIEPPAAMWPDPA
jgi:hypothetical protein